MNQSTVKTIEMQTYYMGGNVGSGSVDERPRSGRGTFPVVAGTVDVLPYLSELSVGERIDCFRRNYDALTILLRRKGIIESHLLLSPFGTSADLMESYLADKLNMSKIDMLAYYVIPNDEPAPETGVTSHVRRLKFVDVGVIDVMPYLSKLSATDRRNCFRYTYDGLEDLLVREGLLDSHMLLAPLEDTATVMNMYLTREFPDDLRAPRPVTED